MNKYFYLLAFAVCFTGVMIGILVISGCNQKQPQQPIIVQPQQPQVAPVTPPVAPQAAPPVTPPFVSPSYKAGYNDGYFGTWLSPIRWTFGEEYRNGWSAGHYDRSHGNPNKHPL